MAYPNDILLPNNAKIFGFVDTKYKYNTHWDIVWSFSFALTGSEHGFSTFLTTGETMSGWGGQFLGYSYSDPNSSFVLSDPLAEIILSEDDEPIEYERYNNGIFVIAFDSTGLFALSSNINSGIGPANVKRNALIIRDDKNNLIFNEHLSSLSTEFFLSSSQKSYQTLRFRFSNSGKKLSIDFKKSNTDYQLLTSIPITFDADSYDFVYPGFTFCSPISSLSTPSTLFLKNFHTLGNTIEPTYETISYVPLSASIPTTYTTISGVSAYPKQ